MQAATDVAASADAVAARRQPSVFPFAKLCLAAARLRAFSLAVLGRPTTTGRQVMPFASPSWYTTWWILMPSSLLTPITPKPPSLACPVDLDPAALRYVMFMSFSLEAVADITTARAHAEEAEQALAEALAKTERIEVLQ